MKSIANIIHQKTFPLRILDASGYLIYYEDLGGAWAKLQYDSNSNRIYYEDLYGFVEDNR